MTSSAWPACSFPRTSSRPSVRPNSTSATSSCGLEPRLTNPSSLKKNGYRGSSVTCPKCQQNAEFHGYRRRQPESIFGTLCCRRAYYYCRRCGEGQFPWDDAVGLTPRHLTPA